jgi:hypothetical protein
MPCSNQSKKAKQCACTHDCARKGNCCECIRYHRSSGELPACYFNAEFEQTYDRSINNYLKMQGRT